MRLCTAQVRDIMKRVRMQFPGADVLASTFDAFVLPLAKAVRGGLQLPVVIQEARPSFPDALRSTPSSPADRMMCKTHSSIHLPDDSLASCRLRCFKLLQIGDTWINGVASDTGKLADYRALQRMRQKLSYDHSQDPAYRNMSRFLLKVSISNHGL